MANASETGWARSLLLICWNCQRPCRALYGYKKGDDGRYYVVKRAEWECRTCAGLRYSSEGGFLRPGRFFRALGNLDRPDLWLPCVYTNIECAAAQFPSVFGEERACSEPSSDSG